MRLKNKTIIITGSSRGIGREMALSFAKEGAQVVITGKSDSPQKLPGTIYSVADEITKLGGEALPLKVDVRFEDQIDNMVAQTLKRFGKIDALINNAGAIQLTPLAQTPPKRLDLMLDINLRAPLVCAHFCLDALKQTKGHIVHLSPPISLKPKWFENHTAYTLSKFGMSLTTLGLAEEFKPYGIAVNSLWPKTLIATAAVDHLMGDAGLEHARLPKIVADAALELITTQNLEITGQHLIDEVFLRTKGRTDFSVYAQKSGQDLWPDLFVEIE